MPQNGELTGDIFIVTKGGMNIKLGLVRVSIIPDTAVGPFLEKMKWAWRSGSDARTQRELSAFQALSDARTAGDAATIEMRVRELTDALNESNYFHSSAYYFSELPQSIAQAKTDADGHFVVSLPRTGRFALAAQATRTVGNTTEKYYWIVWVSLNGAATGNIMLSNDNLTTVKAPESVITLEF
jgi:hypothetical protein